MSEKQEQQNTERSRMLGTMEMRKLVPTVSVPIMVSMLVQALYNIVDGIFVGQYSPDALTAVNLAMPMQMLMIAVSTGMGTGINSLISRRLGEKRPHDARDAARHGILIEVVGWLLFVIVGLFFARAYIGMTNPKAEVLEMGTLYLRIVCTLSLGQFMSICFERMMQATGNTTLSMITQLSGAVTNIILDPILIFSCQMGIAGAAVATVIGQVVSCTAGFVLNQWKNRELRLTHEGFRFDWKTVQNILVVGIPSTIMQAISSVCTTLMNMILAGFGDIYVNVLGVYFKLQSFVFMPVFGLCNGMVPIVGYNFGAQKKKRVYECVRVCLVYALVIMAVGALLFLAVPNLLMMPFDSSADKALTAEGCVALINFLKRTDRLAYFLGIVSDGADTMKNIWNFYTGHNNHYNINDYLENKSLNNIKQVNRKPSILLFDNEQIKDKPLDSFLKYTNLELKDNQISIKLISNLYLQTFPLISNMREAEIEDLYSTEVLNTEIRGKTFKKDKKINKNKKKNSDNDTESSNKHYGKHIFSQYIKENYASIDFTNFIPLLDSINTIVIMNNK